MRNYYDVHVDYGSGGYSVCVSSNDELTDDEITSGITLLGKWEEKGDSYNVDSIESISEKEAFEWYDESRILKVETDSILSRNSITPKNVKLI